MNLLREKARALGHHRACFGGDSSSNSSQTTNNTYTDNRQVNTSTNTSTSLANSGNTDNSNRSNTVNTDSSNRSTTINQGDMGAIKAGQEIAGLALSNNSTNTALVLALGDRLFTAQNRAMDQNLSMAKDLIGGVQSAYSDATSMASGTKNLVMVGIVVVGLAAALMFGGKK